MTTAFEDLPGDLVEELADAGLDPPTSTRTSLAALGEDLPGGDVDVTSVATIPADARGGRRLRRPRARASSPGSASPRWSSTR